jgi:hypothetical protein
MSNRATMERIVQSIGAFAAAYLAPFRATLGMRLVIIVRTHDETVYGSVFTRDPADLRDIIVKTLEAHDAGCTRVMPPDPHSPDVIDADDPRWDA